MIGLGKAPINILMNICLPKTGDFFSKPENPQAYQAFTPLSSTGRQDSECAYFTAQTQGVLSPVSKHVCSPRRGWEHAGDNSDPCPCTAVPTTGRYAAAACQQQAPAPSKGALSQERVWVEPPAAWL